MIPWKEIITWAPTVAKMVRNLRREAGAEAKSGLELDSRDLPATLSHLHERIAHLEAQQQDQAEVLAKIAQQTQALSEGLRVVSARLVLLSCVAGAALLASLGLLIWALLK